MTDTVEEHPPHPPEWWVSLGILVVSILLLGFGDGWVPQISRSLLPLLFGLAHSTQPLASIISLLSLLVILGCIAIYLALFSRQLAPRAASTDAERALGQFLRGWLGIWLTWLFLYICLFYCWANNYEESHKSAMWIVADVFNMLSAVAFFYCFLVLDIPSINTANNRSRAGTFHRYMALIAAGGGVLWLIDVVSAFQPWGDVGRLLVAVYAGLSMAFFIGRLDSHYLEVPRIMLAPLYLYVLIQLAWVYFPRGGATRDVFLGLALLIKPLLFWLVTGWIRDGSIRTYLEEAEKHYNYERATSTAAEPVSGSTT